MCNVESVHFERVTREVVVVWGLNAVCKNITPVVYYMRLGIDRRRRISE